MAESARASVAQTFETWDIEFVQTRTRLKPDFWILVEPSGQYLGPLYSWCGSGLPDTGPISRDMALADANYRRIANYFDTLLVMANSEWKFRADRDLHFHGAKILADRQKLDSALHVVADLQAVLPTAYSHEEISRLMSEFAASDARIAETSKLYSVRDAALSAEAFARDRETLVTTYFAWVRLFFHMDLSLVLHWWKVEGRYLAGLELLPEPEGVPLDSTSPAQGAPCEPPTAPKQDKRDGLSPPGSSVGSHTYASIGELVARVPSARRTAFRRKIYRLRDQNQIAWNENEARKSQAEPDQLFRIVDVLPYIKKYGGS